MKDKCERLFEKVSVAQAADELHYHLVTVRDGMHIRKRRNGKD